MIESMTGFGRGTAEVGGITATVEMRSINSRFCEISTRLPRVLSDYEAVLQSMLKQAFSRGRITVQVQIEEAPDELLPIRVDESAARAYTQLLEKLRLAAGIKDPVKIEHLLTFSEIFTTVDDGSPASEIAWEATRKAIEISAEALHLMRRQEGEALRLDLQARIDTITERLSEVEKRAPERVTEARQRLHSRLADFFTDERVNSDRLEMEITLLADRLDVTEEIVRLRSHLQVFTEALNNPEPVGRKLNFLVQEINREVNTIGSKANDSAVAHLAVEMKEELERIREQVQNIE